jgi:diguanylate cyclase (GGDEF)-like protein/PAS domain S-box-containing protein
MDLPSSPKQAGAGRRDRMHQIRALFDAYIEMYASRDERLTECFSENFSGYTGGGNFLVKDRDEWARITRQDFSQVRGRIRIEMLDFAMQDLSEEVVVVTAFFHIHLPLPDHILSRETARLVLIFRLEGERWMIVHSGISIPYHLVQEGEVYPLKGLQERNSALLALVEERTQALRESESRMRSVLDTAMDAVIAMDDQGRITDWNARAEAMFGWTKAEVMGRALHDTLIPPRYRQAHRDSLALFLATGETHVLNRRIEISALRRNGEEFPVDLSISSVKNRDRYDFTAFIADTSERKKKEDRLLQLTTRLTEREALYRLLAEDALDVVWKTDCDLHITYISPADERLRGYRADEVIGRHVFEMFSEEGVATVSQLLRQRRVAETEGSQTGFFTFAVQHRCKDGRLIWGEVLSKPERDAEGAIIGYHGITREITERKRLEDQVRQLAFYDPLTQLPNRRLLDDRLTQLMAATKRSACYGAVMMLDLDNFKSLNDTQGHLAGDLLLIEAARRLTSCVREIDTVARFGGDEFVVLLNDLDEDQVESASQAAIVAEKIRISLGAPYLLKLGHDARPDSWVEHRCSASIGVVVFIGNEASQDEVLKWADAAMYQAKDAGRNLIRFCGLPV